MTDNVVSPVAFAILRSLQDALRGNVVRTSIPPELIKLAREIDEEMEKLDD